MIVHLHVHHRLSVLDTVDHEIGAELLKSPISNSRESI